MGVYTRKRNPGAISYQSSEFVRIHALELLTLGQDSHHHSDFDGMLWDTTFQALKSHDLVTACEGDGQFRLKPRVYTAARDAAPARVLPCKCTGFRNTGHVQCHCGQTQNSDTIKRCLFDGGGH